MKTDQSTSNPKKLQLEWHMKNFLHYFNLINELESLTIPCEKFIVDLSRSSYYQFSLEITILSRSISCSLHYDGNKQFGCLTCQLSLMNNNGQVLETQESKIRYDNFVNKSSINLGVLRLCSSDLISKRIDLFPDGNLKILCKLIILEDTNARIQPISSLNYTLKPCPLIKDHFQKLLTSGNGSDVVIEVDGKEYYAHKSVLLARSPVFATMFQHEMIEKNTNRVTITDISESTFNLLLNFIYTDEINTQLDIETGKMLLEAASKYRLDGLKNICATQLFKLITVNNVEEIRTIAETHNLTNFIKSIDDLTKFHGKII